MVATMVAALVFLIKSYRQSEIAANESISTNNAVNNVGPGAPTIYSEVQHIKAAVDALLAANQEFSDKGWRSLPVDIGTAAGLTETIRDLQHEVRDLQHENRVQTKQVDTVLTELRGHVEWELQQKYPHQGSGS